MIRQIVGKKIIERPGLPDGFDSYELDLGTGDGKYVLDRAAKEPHRLIIGVDASADMLVKTSHKAASNPKKGGLANAFFVWSAAENLPTEITNVHAVTILMPWGSLLRGLMQADPTILEPLVRCCAPNASIFMTVNLHAWRPRVPEVADTEEPTVDWVMDSLSQAYRQAGITIVSAGALTPQEAANHQTSWTKRLSASRLLLDVLVIRSVVNK